MSLKSWSPGKSVTSPRGAWSLVGLKHTGNPARASSMVNMRINPGVAVSRPAMVSTGFTASKSTGITNWIAPSGANYIVYQDGLQVLALNQATRALAAIYTTLNVYFPIFADIDVWLYFCGIDNNGGGAYQAQVFDGVHTDTAFRGPITIATTTAVDGGAGQCTAGTHSIGFVYMNRTGFSTQPTILAGGAPITVTLNAGLRKVNISVNVPALLDGGTNTTGAQATLYLIATRADNPNLWYWVPAAAGGNTTVNSQPVPHNNAVTLNFVMDISDEDLAAEADPANGPNANPDQFLILAQDGAGAGPFIPNFIVPYGTRLCYGAGSTLWVSDQNAPQLLRSADSFVNMPNQRNMAMAFQLPNSQDLYITADRWTARVAGTDGTPSTWAQPVEVSGALGAPFPNCVCYRTCGNYAWLVTERGVELFDGHYTDKPITYLVSDIWKRVNWMAAHSIQIADETSSNHLYVGVPLDGADACSHCFMIDYTNGTTFDTCDISLDSYGQGRFSSLAIVKEVATNQSNLWKGPSQPNAIERSKSVV